MKKVVIGWNLGSGLYDLSVIFCLLLALIGVVDLGLLGGPSFDGLPSGVGRL